MESWGSLFVLVGPGGRISTVDCIRVLNVKRSLYGSTSRGRAQQAPLYAAPTCTTVEAPVVSTVVLLLEDSRNNFLAFCTSVTVCLRASSGN